MLDDSEKSEGCRKPKVAVDEFQNVVSELAMVDVKPDNGWFIWTNNRKGSGLVKKRIDRFLVCTNWLKDVSFLFSNMIRQASPDHDVILLNALGQTPKNMYKDLRLMFRFEECWARKEETKRVIKNA